jgi:coenzyme PQQ precursor peptide PqqA
MMPAVLSGAASRGGDILMERLCPSSRYAEGFGLFAARETTSANFIEGGHYMVWTTPTLVEVCVGLEINGYLPAEF